MPEVINKSVHGMGFGFMHDDEIKKLSVKQLTNSQSFDSLRQPVIGGLYDRSYGPTDPFDTCDTCELTERDCPGHPGHLQLAVPLYDIFLLELLIKLLNAKCWNCHHLRLATLKKKFVYAQLLYLNAAQILRAREVAELMNPSIFRKNDENTQSIEQQLDAHIRQAQELNASVTPTQSRLTFHVSRARNELIKSFMGSAKTANGRCQNCGACSPAVRRDGFTKIFVQSLNSRQRAHNDKIGIRIHSIMSKSQYENEFVTASEPIDDKEAKKKFKKEQKRLAKLAAAKKKKNKKSGDDGDDSSDDDSDLDDLEDELIQQNNDQAEDVFGEAEHSLAAKAKKEQQSEEIFTKINSKTDVEETTSRLILPNEVERHMALLWGSNDTDFLSMLFCPGTRQTVASNPFNGNDYRAFFHRVLLVPPSRFRPPRYVNGEFFESSTNVSYRKIFDSNEEIVRTVFQSNTAPNSTGAVLIGEDAENAKKLQASVNTQDTESKLEKLSPVARKRVVEAWIAMQHELNLFYDSDKTGNHLVKGSGSAGIKQILEKKQGLFRKHMMGKRVNFAARSVISPDPYLHSREIGVPEIFAKTLTFPEPVTSFNYQELRNAVINGPFVHPGANSVITSRGREIKLSTQTLDQRTALANQLLGQEGEANQPHRRGRDVTNIEKNLSSELVGDTGPMVVLRHLRSGDVLLVNRQPTLHKPSMMAHVARVLFGENVIRMHYSNCIAEGTLVQMADGSKKPIESVKTGEKVLTWGAREAPPQSDDAPIGNDLGASHLVTQGEWSRGEQQCFTLTLQDGRQLTATGDHRILAVDSGASLSQATFVTVNHLMDAGSNMRVVCNALGTNMGAPDDDVQESTFALAGISYQTDKARVCALARLLGHLIADGNLNVIQHNKDHQYGSHYLDTWHDASSLIQDAQIVDPDVKYDVNAAEGRTMGAGFRVQFNSSFSDYYVKAGVQAGPCADFSSTLPQFVADPSTPLDVVRNFLSGFWGGDGASPTFLRANDDAQDDDASPYISRCGLVTTLSREGDNAAQREALDTTMDALKFALHRVGCEVSLHPRDICSVNESDGSQRIMSYSASQNLEVQKIYYRVDVALSSESALPFFNNVTISYSADKVAKWNLYCAYRSSAMRVPASSPDFAEFLRQSGFNWHHLGRDASPHSFSLAIENIKSVGIKKVYDLEVDTTHNFVAGGIVVHNCNSYNADFDGDEMNLHFPQNQLARIEAYDIANNDNQYIVPTSGNPLRGLIQDHVVCGVRLTSRDCFLNREYFHQFLFLAIADRDVQNGSMIVTPEPAILKPRPLWTGKQIINNILDFIADNRPPLNLAPTKAKVPGISWGKQGQEDGVVIVRENKLVQGVLDKAMFGASKHGLVHAIYELYGAKAAGNILSIFSRLFTRVLQYDAFTCGIEDFLLTPEVDTLRRVAIEQSVWDGVQATATWAGMEGDVKTFGPGKINENVQRMFAQHKNAGETLDNAMKAALSQNTSNIIKLCIPNGQRIPFPRNNMAMMTLSGAKGSAVNHSQIACLLGQQELEGRRVPVTMAGKTLPSFPRYDPQPRSGGYISQRFFTGIRPQEYFFHAQSGREGLVDTAVKTARSGYLQRCLIKLLEGLNIKYDNTVRDVDNSIVQFQYGEDGIDPVKAGYLASLPFLANNFNLLMHKLNPFDALELLDDESVDKYRAQIQEQQEQLAELEANHAKLCKKEEAKIAEASGSKKDKEIAKIAEKRAARVIAINTAKEQFNLIDAGASDPISSKFPIAKTLGAVSEKFQESYHDYIKKDPDDIFSNAALMQARWTNRLDEKKSELTQKSAQLKSMAMSSSSSSTKYRVVQSQVDNLQDQMKEIQTRLDTIITPEKFVVLMNLYYMYILAHPGENVGVLAGQSVGEPSTQMTLNTFHLAGHGGANVTLGIPRLREIVMTASDHISTPVMELPLANPSNEAAIKLAAKLNKVRLSECLQSIAVTQTMRESGSRQYKIRLALKDLDSEWAANNLITPYNIAKCIAIEFSRKLQASIQTKLRTATSGVLSSRLHRSHAEVMTSAEEDASVDDFDNEDLSNEMDASERRKMRDLEEGITEQQRSQKKKQQSSYDDDESDQEEDSDSDSDDDHTSKKSSKSKKSSMDDIDSESDDSDDDNSDDDLLGDDSDDETMGDKPAARTKKPAAAKKAKKAASSKPVAAKLTTDNELTALESSAADFTAFAKKLVPYWGRHHYISSVDFDKDNQYVDIVVITPQGASKLLMLSTIESLCEVCRVRYTDGINKAIAIDRKLGDGRKVKIVQTDGVNLQAVTKIDEIDHVNIKTNDIHRILKTYGVEAACNAIRSEISGVFAVYGIVVDPRHLSLIADFMTFQGGYHAMNRNAMGSRPSVLQKATFETSLRFILDACQSGEFDHLTSPSSSIIVGKPIQTGTGTFELRHPLPSF